MNNILQTTSPYIDLRCCDVADLLPTLPDGYASLVHVDAPWRFEQWSERRHGASASHYSGLPIEVIASHVADTFRVGAVDCYMVMWCCWPKLSEWLSYATQERLAGWRYITGGSWHKSNGMGIGVHLRGDSEPLLVYRKGRPLPHRTTSNAWSARRTGHSVKPEKVLAELIAMATAPNELVLDLYAGASASMPRVCRRYGRRYLGAEKDIHYHAAALRALSLPEQSSMDLLPLSLAS